MDKDLGAVMVLVTIFLLFAMFVAGHKTGRIDSFDMCIDYHSDMTVVDARALCKKIASGKK